MTQQLLYASTETQLGCESWKGLEWKSRHRDVSKTPKPFPFAFHPPSTKELTFLSSWALQKPSSKLRRSGPAGRNKLYPGEKGELEKLPSCATAEVSILCCLFNFLSTLPSSSKTRKTPQRTDPSCLLVIPTCSPQAINSIQPQPTVQVW